MQHGSMLEQLQFGGSPWQPNSIIRGVPAEAGRHWRMMRGDSPHLLQPATSLSQVCLSARNLDTYCLQNSSPALVGFAQGGKAGRQHRCRCVSCAVPEARHVAFPGLHCLARQVIHSFDVICQVLCCHDAGSGCCSCKAVQRHAVTIDDAVKTLQQAAPKPSSQHAKLTVLHTPCPHTGNVLHHRAVKANSEARSVRNSCTARMHAM